jgi:uncharacterized SAM-binding protein YcdF (DUF218 family)
MKAVIILAHWMDKQGHLDQETQDRIRLAYDQFHQIKADFFITTGWNYRDDTPLCLGNQVAEVLIQDYGISRQKILTDNHARDTVGDAYFIRKNILSAYDVRNVVVVTSDYHANRAGLIFRTLLPKNIDVDVCSAQSALLHDPAKIQHEQQSTQAFIDTFRDTDTGCESSIYNTLRHRHPFYNGEIFALI